MKAGAKRKKAFKAKAAKAARQKPIEVVKVEYLMARDNKTWDTVVVDIPASIFDEQEGELFARLGNYMQDNVLTRPEYQDVVRSAVYEVHGG